MKNVFKRIPKTFILVILVWVLIIYNILNRWNLISSEGYIIVEFFIYLLSLITLIWGLIWAIKHKSIKTKKFSILIICIALECVYTFSGFADISKLYIDFCSHYTQREQIVEQILNDYNNEIKAGKQYPKSSILIKGKYNNLAFEDYVYIWKDRGCIEVDFQLFDGRTHGFIDFFNYGKSGHLTYVTDESHYNLSGGTIRKDVISTKKLFGKWFYTVTRH